ncbi:uncharacterized protein LOC111910877 [Lactuca sativa]|uniref:uncharacterized protein LOC111910877 n=1 Tax=Lactuca sativa TaxID=4236 RepID=UPI000CD9F7C0|nr:uncharacterized protein LOC111910877 [Lactuca sativa]
MQFQVKNQAINDHLSQPFFMSGQLYPFFYLHFTPSTLKGVSDYQPFPISYFQPSPSHLRLVIPRRRLRLAPPPSRPVACSTAVVHHLPPVCFTGTINSPNPRYAIFSLSCVDISPTLFLSLALLDLFVFVRDMDSKEQSEKLKNYEAQYANYLKAKYFSDKDIYGGNIFEEKTTIGGMTIRASSEPGTRSYADPVGYWNEKYVLRVEPSTETTTTTNISNGNHSSKNSA